MAEVERTIGVDVEVAARADRRATGRVHLDRFLDETATFAAEADEATLRAFLAFLEAAEEEENGLEAGEVVVESERVQILTVHGAKGLEWDIVAVPGLVDDVFPARRAATTGPAPGNCCRCRCAVTAELPPLDIYGATTARAAGGSRPRLGRPAPTSKSRGAAPARGTAAGLRRVDPGPAHAAARRLRMGRHRSSRASRRPS